MSDKFDEDGFSVKPKHLGEHAWFYEGKKGLTIAYVAKGTLQDIVGMVEIPWHRLKPSIERYQKSARRKASKRS